MRENCKFFSGQFEVFSEKQRRIRRRRVIKARGRREGNWLINLVTMKRLALAKLDIKLAIKIGGLIRARTF